MMTELKCFIVVIYFKYVYKYDKYDNFKYVYLLNIYNTLLKVYILLILHLFVNFLCFSVLNSLFFSLSERLVHVLVVPSSNQRSRVIRHMAFFAAQVLAASDLCCFAHP